MLHHVLLHTAATELPGTAELSGFVSEAVAADSLQFKRILTLGLEPDAVLSALLSPFYATGFERPQGDRNKRITRPDTFDSSIRSHSTR